MATIVCAVDESPGSREALRTASALSSALGLRLVLAHVAKRLRHSAAPAQAAARDRGASLLPASAPSTGSTAGPSGGSRSATARPSSPGSPPRRRRP